MQVASTSIASPIPQKSVARADVRLVAALEQAGLRFRTTPEGNCVVEYALGGQRVQPVILNSNTRDVCDVEEREVYTIVYAVDRRLDAPLLYDMLRANGAAGDAGAFEITHIGPRDLVLFNARVRADLGPDQLRSLVARVAETGFTFKQRFLAQLK